MSAILPASASLPSFARAAATSTPLRVAQGAPHGFDGPVQSIDGVPVGAATMADVVELVVALTRTRRTDVLVGVNAHVVNLARRDARLRTFLASTAVNYADGQSVVWASRLLGAGLPERVATTDLVIPVLAAAEHEAIPVYFLGGRPGVAEEAALRARERLPRLALRASHGYLDDAATAAVLDDMGAHGTRILFLGLGDPLQEEWISRHRGSLPPVVLTCGGLFDWLSGAHRRAPGWMRTSGLEWLWRLAIEPRRLARRYFVGNPAFVAAVLRQRRADRALLRREGPA